MVKGIKPVVPCYSCGVPLTFGEFARTARRVDGLRVWCATCVAQENADPEAHKLEMLRGHAKRYYENHREEALGKAKQRYRQDSAPRREYAKLHRKAHPDKYRKVQEARRKREAAAPNDGTVTIAAIQALYATWSGICPRCGRSALPTIDHIVSLKAGGAHSMGNLQLLCRSCNSSKGAFGR